MKFEVGQRVKILDRKDDYFDQIGVVTGRADVHDWWVEFENEEAVPYYEAELALIDAPKPVANVTTMEGVVGDDIGYPTIGGEYIGLPLRSLVGKRVKLTLEVID